MYYPSVNRGLSFTKPGIYAFALVLLVGMVAVSSGINGLYVFLSAGLGGFIVSGMLSELAIRSCTVRSVTAALVHAEAPFGLSFLVENSSAWFSVFAMRCNFLTLRPRFRLIAGEVQGPGAVLLARVPPASQEIQTAMIKGLPRGAWTKLFVLQSTTFPFGILEKFKLLEVEVELLVAPRLDPAEVASQRLLLHSELQRLASEQEFHSHRPYRGREARRGIDWKKSANRPVSDWVVRDLRTPVGSSEIWLELSWAVLRQCPDEASYEALLVRATAALAVLDSAQVGAGLDFGGGELVAGSQACLMALAQVPQYHERSKGLPRAWAAQRPALGAAPRRVRLLA